MYIEWLNRLYVWLMTTVVSYSQDKIELILYFSCNFQIVLYIYHENSETRKSQQSGIRKTIAKKLSSNANSDFTQTSNVRDPRTADSGRNWTAQYSTWHLQIYVFSSEQQITWYLNWNRGRNIPSRIGVFISEPQII